LVEQAGKPVVRAAGGVVWRQGAGANGEQQIEVAIIHRPRYDDWSIPKGKLVPGESDLEGAIREIAEETGYRVRVGRPLGEVTYVKRMGTEDRQKVVRYWSMFAEGGMFTPTREVDQLRWVPVAEAVDILTTDRDQKVMQAFASLPALARTVLLVRHGSAGSRSSWDGDDHSRPLDDLGRAQSDGLTWLLTRFDVRDIVSSHYARCTMTVEPLSSAVGLSIREEFLLSEDGYPGREHAAATMLRNLGADNSAAVACSHGDMIPELVHRIALEDGYEIETPVPSKKGSVWSLTFSGQQLIAAEYFPPLAN
jgi:8-oxo-dGTP diphosphatase